MGTFCNALVLFYSWSRRDRAFEQQGKRTLIPLLDSPDSYFVKTIVPAQLIAIHIQCQGLSINSISCGKMTSNLSMFFQMIWGLLLSDITKSHPFTASSQNIFILKSSLARHVYLLWTNYEDFARH